MAEQKSSLSKEYVIPLRGKFRHVARYKKTPKAIKSVKEFLARHMKIYDRDLNKIKLDTSVNEFLWARGIKNPPHKIKIKATKEKDFVKVELVELPNKLKFKKLREEKQAKAVQELKEKKKSLKDKVQETMKGGQKKENKEGVDEDKDGVDDKKETEEKKKAVKEAGEKQEKDMAKQEKHIAKAQSPKEQKNQRTGYNKSSRGH